MNRGPRYLWGDLLAAEMVMAHGDVPDPVQQLYAAAYRVLAADPAATFADLARDDAFRAHFPTTRGALLGGPMLGVLAPDGFRVWVRTLEPADVAVEVSGAAGKRTFGPVRSTDESDLTAVVAVSGLTPDTRYAYRILVDGRPVDLRRETTVRTAPDPHARGRWRCSFLGTSPSLIASTTGDFTGRTISSATSFPPGRASRPGFPPTRPGTIMITWTMTSAASRRE